MIMKNNKGLSFLEVIAIIVIIGILSSIAYVVYDKYFAQSELASGRTQAKVIQDLVAKYTADNNGQLPTLTKDDDFIEKPASIDLSKINSNLQGDIKGNYYIYGPAKEVSFDYPERFIEKVYSSIPDNKKQSYIISGTPYIDTDKLQKDGFIQYPTFTTYMWQNDGTVIQLIDDKYKNPKPNQGSDKPTKPIIIPSKSKPYLSTDEITFTANSYSALGEVTYEWTGISSNNKYPIGKTTITVTAIDKNGQRSTSDPFILEVVSNASINKPPSTPVITVSPVKPSYTSDEVITFSATAIDPEGDAITYVWIGKSANNTYPRGEQTVSVYAIDSYGNTSPKASKTISITNSKPKIKGVTTEPNPAYVFDNVDFKVDASDPDGDMLSFEWKDVQPSRRYPIGTHTGQVRAKDSLGAYSDWFTFTFTITNRLPSVPTLTMVPDKTSDIRSFTKITFTASGSTDPDEVASNLKYEWDNKLDYYKVGTHTVKVRAVDSHGGKSDWASITFKVNNTLPTIPTLITMTHGNPLYADTPITWAVSGSIDQDGIAPSPDGDFVTYEWLNKATTYVKGTHTVQARASDTHGGKSPYLSKTFTVVNKPPTTPVISMNPGPTTDLRTNTIITWGATSTDVDIADTISYEWINKQNKYPKGLNTVKVRAKDSDGAYSDYATISFTVNNTKPTEPTSIIMTPNANTTNVYANTNVSFQATGSIDIDGDSFVYEYSESTSSIVPLKTKYPRGTHTIYARAKDVDGAVSNWVPLTFTIKNSIPTKPTIAMSPSSNLFANTAITWTSSGSTDVDGDNLTYNWTNKKTYYPKGTHTTSVNVTDGFGGTSETNSITFNVQNSIPSAVNSFYVSLPGGYSYNVSFTRGTSTDVDGDALIYEYQVDGGAWTTNSPNGDYTRSAHTVSVRAKDTDGAVSTPVTVRFSWNSSYERYEVIRQDWVPTTYKKVWVPPVYKSVPWCAGYSPNGNWYEHSPPCDFSYNQTTKQELVTAGYYDTVVDVPGHYVDVYGYVSYPPYWYSY